MGGYLQECGCYDGPLSEDDPRLVSVRCVEHRKIPAYDTAHQLQWRTPVGVIVSPDELRTPAERRAARGPRMAIPRKRRAVR